MKKGGLCYNKNAKREIEIGVNDIIGINEVAIDNLILDIRDKIELCSSILNEIEDRVNDTLANYKSDDKSILSQKFQYLKSNFPILISNLETYSNDLVRVKNGYTTIDKIATTKVTNLQNTIKEVK